MLPAFLSPAPRPRRAWLPPSWRSRWRRLRHRPLVRGGLAMLLAATCGLFVWRLVVRAESAAARYGSTVLAPIASRDVAAGEVVSGGDVRWERVPRAFVPSGGAARRPVGRTAAAAILDGEVIVEKRLAPHGLHGAAALVPPGARALAVPAGPGTPHVARGDHVDLLAVGGDGAAAPSSRVVAQRAVVIDAGDDAVTVAVTSAEAPAVAAALARGGVTVALVGAS